MQLKLNAPSHRRSPARKRARIARWLPLLLLAMPGLFWLGQRQFKLWTRSAEAIVVLGGEIDREAYAAQMAQEHGQLSVWVSSGTNKEYAEWLFFEKSGIERDRLHLDYRAVDTVTNFTTLVNDLKREGIDKIYLITSENHMRRARLVGEIVFGSHDIVFEPIAVPSLLAAEPVNKTLRDGIRAVMWTFTGYSGADLADLKNASFSQILRGRSRS
jgi:uncharacterized SAM-binding protein YcdF (DUF218 family)